MPDQQYKVFIGLREIAGYFSSLKKGFDENGIECAFLNLGGNRFNYSAGKNPIWISSLNFVGVHFGSKFSKNFVLRFLWLVIFQNIFSLFAFFLSVFKYDVFIFGGNSSFFFFLDLPILKLLRKKIIFVFLGTDSRPLYLNGYVFNGEKKIALMTILTWIQKRVIKFIENHATVIINHPPQAYFHEKNYIAGLLLGIPYENISLNSKETKKSNQGYPLRIIHIPSKSGPKGSIKFSEIITRLKSRYNIEYIEISGIPHNKVIDIIRTADFAIDELYSDTPMAVFATECAFHRVPSVVGSYYAEMIKEDFLDYQIPPSLFVFPEEIEKAIEKMITDKEFRLDLANKAYDFVTSNWSASIVAEKYLRLIRGDIPKDWYMNPYSISYLYGCGLEKSEVKRNISLFVNKGGIGALCLRDKPELESKYLEWLNQAIIS
jgi:glycosyltransferase involved in cell wall biosynthesis